MVIQVQGNQSVNALNSAEMSPLYPGASCNIQSGSEIGKEVIEFRSLRRED
ncbi:hypothetical protein KIN20_026065 [Parelaphostrongylus tenuis]|uniref:Uncharacterized protein n=1 Tax=Parelaphostrongylus tenuis TaxID=148309 RepID=A0AAD5QWZ0_PARTN|nr:hypothetical protein KIN20_026065 [Parelaphostrongylus tenuis]